MLESQNPAFTVHLQGPQGNGCVCSVVVSHNPTGFSLFLRKICLLIVTVCHIPRIKKMVSFYITATTSFSWMKSNHFIINRAEEGTTSTLQW